MCRELPTVARIAEATGMSPRIFPRDQNPDIADEVKSRLNLPATANFGNLPDTERQAFARELIAAIQPRSAVWRKEAIREMRQSPVSEVSLPLVDTRGSANAIAVH